MARGRRRAAISNPLHRVRAALVVLLTGALVAGAGVVQGTQTDQDWAITPSANAGAGNNFLNGLWCGSASDCWAAGYSWTGSAYETLILRWGGSEWSVVPSPNAPVGNQSFLQDITCSSASRCWAVGYAYLGNAYQPLLLGWDGSSWARSPTADTSATRSDFLFGVACASDAACWAVGRSLPGVNGGGGPDRLLIMRWNGSSWSEAPAPHLLPSRGAGLNAVSCVDSDECWAVGRRTLGPADQTLTLRWDGETWTDVPSPSTRFDQRNVLSGVTCISDDDCWAVGVHDVDGLNRTLILRWNGASWGLVPSPNPRADQPSVLFDVSCLAPWDCWAVGYERPSLTIQTLMLRWDGTAWTIASSPNTSPGQTNTLRGVACVSASGCWTVGNFYNAQVVSRTLTARYSGTPTWERPSAAPQIFDAAGDANLVNGQGTGENLDVVSAPASIESADILSIGFRTTFELERDFDEDGDVLAVRHVATGVRMTMVTMAPPSPTFGPSVVFRVPFTVGSCEAVIAIRVAGTLPGSPDRQEAAIEPGPGCGDRVVGTLALEDRTTVATFTFEGAGDLMRHGAALGPLGRPSARIATDEGPEAGPAIDEAPPLPGFAIGSDLPADIDCTATAGHPACGP